MAKGTVDRGGLEVVSPDECWQMLRSARVGRVAFVSEGVPLVLPVNHAVDRGTIVYRTAPGSKLDAATRARAVAFEVDGYDEEARTGWSVLVRGTAEVVSEDEEVRRLGRIGLETWADVVERGEWVRIRPDEVTGRRIVRGGR